MKTEDNYVPGVCNIGNDQLKKRKRFLLKCILATTLCIISLEVCHLDKAWKLLMVIPFSLTAVGAQQVIFKFCYIFGLKSYYGFGEVGKAKKVEEDAFRKLDRIKSQKMLISSLLIGIFLSVLYYYF